MAEDETGGWCSPSYEEVFGYPDLLEFPRIFFPRYRVETMVQSAKKRFLRRRMWQLHVRYWDPAHQKHMHHYMVFASEQDANNAEQIVKFMIKNINDQVEEEKRAR